MWALIGALVMGMVQPARAEGDRRTPLEYRCVAAAGERPVRACAGDDCEALFMYEAGTLMAITAAEGEWLEVRDPLTDQTGYIRADGTAACEAAAWQTAPAIPEVSARAREVYQQGLARGNDARAFSKVGDCQSVPQFFLAFYEQPERFGAFDLGAWQAELTPTLDQFAGSFERFSRAVDNGFNVASVLTPLWADPAWCKSDESPLMCEERLHNPSIVVLSMETWWAGKKADEYERYLERVVAFWVEQQVVVILATIADNLEKVGSINAAIARVAARYEMPLWNFWLVAQALPDHGLHPDGFHLTFAQNRFDDGVRLRHGWPARNLSALRVLDAVWRGLKEK
jgi:hypothetical protein